MNNAAMVEAADRLFTGRMRMMQLVSLASILFAAAVFAVVVGKHWSWGPFLLAPALVAAGAVANAFMTHRAIESLRPDAEQRRKAAARRRTRNTVIVPAYITSGVAWGLIAGSLRTYWADLAFGVMTLFMSVLIPLAALRLVTRRVEGRPPTASTSGE